MKEKIKLKMNITKRGMLDRFTPYCFAGGRVYNVPKDIAEDFIKEKVATVYKGEEQKETINKKKNEKN